MRKLLVLAVLLVLFSPAVAMAGTDIDVAGIWDLQAETPVPNQGAQGEGEVPPICLFEGTAQVSQDGTSLTGNAALALADGPVECPMELSASFTGNVSGSSIQMGMLMGGNLGTASFTGGQGDFPDTLQGSMNVDSGPFNGITGFWTGARRQSVLDIPTLGGAGLVLLILALLAAATFVLRRHRIAG